MPEEWIVDIGDGEKVHYTVRRARDSVPMGKYLLYAEGDYRGEHFSISDNGFGEEILRGHVVEFCLRKKKATTQNHP